ncbi:putative polypeptide N-acetylgalactosaminyltransferase 9 [Anopheles darlingi]|uniref:putative polypeptide N-acetylgalactosaminyltransferase 9 n=1 Tax=Anopheles darlingi TaxID=43151 RepID=UPI0021003186|nr:putative polypeptide N-acetylgalactosaminyltransferase 9 [Anopheles darlingi]
MFFIIRSLLTRPYLFIVLCIAFVFLNIIIYLSKESVHPQTASNDVYPLLGSTKALYPPGDMGGAVILNKSNPSIAKAIRASMKRYGLNEYASDLVSMHRRLPIVPDPWCQRAAAHFLPNLPPTSIVVVFYNEAWSVLVRTVHSILDHSPPHLLQEIILVDDYSSLPHLKTQLKDYFEAYPKVRIIRAAMRMGLIKARVLGAKMATSEVLTFLDAHVECAEGWLEPLLDQVARNETTVALPTIDKIDPLDLGVSTNISLLLAGAFEWDLNFGWCERKQLHKRYAHPLEPFDTPAMAGGLFTIRRSFFERLGWYDEGFDIYGMENIELSLKTWMCGGQLLTVPCSRVGHIQKEGHPYIQNIKRDVQLYNSIRLAEVWMDEYKRIVFDVNGVPYFSEELFGSVETRQRFRQQAGCKPFRYYLETVFPELTIPNVFGQFRGKVKNVALGHDHCLTVVDTAKDSPHMAPCKEADSDQFWTHSYYSDINSYKMCLDFTGTRLRSIVCHRRRGNQGWMYVVETKQIWNMGHGSCLAVSTHANGSSLVMQKCNENSKQQQWLVTFIDYSDLY